MRRLVVALACRNNGSRLYGKPLQNLDIENRKSILKHLIECFSEVEVIEEIVLGISEGLENQDFIEFSEDNGISYIIGDEDDVLSRLISCGIESNATDILRVTSESPFPMVDLIEEAWNEHIVNDYDASFLDEVVDGCGFEIISLSALKRSHEKGSERHRSELCTLYIRENKESFNISFLQPPEFLIRKDLRLTVDYPEDLVVCREVYSALSDQAPTIDLSDVIEFLDSRPDLKKLISPFCEEGYSTMYI